MLTCRTTRGRMVTVPLMRFPFVNGPWMFRDAGAGATATDLAPAARGAAGTGALAEHQGQPVVRAAWMMTLATANGLEIMDRCGALISVICACARWAMNSCSAGVMMWSFRPTMSQDGMVAQAGVPDWSANVPVARGRWVAASTAPSLAGRPLAKQPGNTVGLT